MIAFLKELWLAQSAARKRSISLLELRGRRPGTARSASQQSVSVVVKTRSGLYGGRSHGKMGAPALPTSRIFGDWVGALQRDGDYT